MDTENESEEEWNLRSELGLPPVTSEEGGPEVDIPLLEQFLSDEEIKPELAEKVLDHVGRYEHWRKEYSRIAVRNYRQRVQAMGADPDPPELS